MLKKIFLTLFVLLLAAAGAGGAWLYQAVVVEPGEEIQADNIRSILGRESNVYYSDGINKLGVFFDTSHRQYVSYGEIPTDFVNALVAAEDNRFFSHYGFDVQGITRAMIKNIEAGRVVQGGSTITQQTAKNLFDRTERSYERKLIELLYALRLEYHYPKEQIFEFYANQFYVSGNGHGLGVAARYYFDKSPEELTLVECAFIAGSVKRPNYYNPFRKKTEQAAEIAHDRAKTRLKYVLGKMHELGMIDTTVYNEALAADIEFKNGRVGYSLDIAMELVREAVSSTEVRNALEANNIENIATSGVRVITTIDQGVQEKTLSSLRKELSKLDVRLRGYEREELQNDLKTLDYGGDSILKNGAFIFGTVSAIEGKSKDTRVEVLLDKQLGTGFVEAADIEPMVDAWVKFHSNRWTNAGKKDLDRFMQQIEVGDRVWVSVNSDGSDGGPIGLALEKYPLVQGAAIVVQHGRIKALAGGSENRFFNRAIHAKRIMGSAFKPLVYTAALQLGWNSADLLNNTRNVFVYHDQPYYPRPDHVSPHGWVSMSWAGVTSENVASVWLLARLCEKLTPMQFRDLAEKVGLAPRVVDGRQEPYRAYTERIRDQFGIQMSGNILRQTAFDMAVKNLETDFIFDGMVADYQKLKELHYGLHFERYRKELQAALAQEKPPVKESTKKEYRLRQSLLRYHFLKMETLRKELRGFRKALEKSFDEGWFKRPSGQQDSGGQEEKGSGSLYVNKASGTYYFFTGRINQAGLVPVMASGLRDYLQQLGPGEVTAFWESVELDGRLSVAAFDKLSAQLEHEYKQLAAHLPFDFEVLSQVRDFRITAGLFYLIQLSEQLGIQSNLEPVLSFPLGSNVVSLLETTRMYEGLVTGRVTTFGSVLSTQQGEEEEGGANDALALLDRIESAEGEILYQPEPLVRQVIDAKTALATSSILENVVKFGTGRYATKHVKFTAADGAEATEIEEMDLLVPLLGKTGTANRYTNGSFLGYVPEVNENGAGMTLDGGYAVGVYAGFDDNRAMRHKGTRITGAAGALPTWSRVATALLEEKEYNTRLDPVDLSFSGLMIKRPKLGQINIGVKQKGGGVVSVPVQKVSELSPTQASIMTFGRVSAGGRLNLQRYYRPYWGNSGGDVQ